MPNDPTPQPLTEEEIEVLRNDHSLHTFMANPSYASRIVPTIDTLKSQLQAERQKPIRQIKLAGNHGMKSYQELDSEITLLKRNQQKPFPDIGDDPLQNRSVDTSIAGAMERLGKGVAMQQTGVPDQTMLAWRIDVDRLRCEVTWRTSAMNGLVGKKDSHEQMAGLLEQFARIVELAGRLKCPACDGSGHWTNSYDDEVECDWCAERAEILSCAPKT